LPLKIYKNKLFFSLTFSLFCGMGN